MRQTLKLLIIFESYCSNRIIKIKKGLFVFHLGEDH